MKTFSTIRKMLMLTTMLFAFTSVFAQGTLNYTVSGLQANDKSVVSLGSNAYLDTKTISADGSYTFTDIPAGEYFIKIEANGYNLPDAQTVIVHENGSIDPAVGIKMVITKMEADSDTWTHSWSEDVSNSGYTKTAYVNNPPEIEFLGKKIVPSDVAFAGELKNKYNIILSDEEEMWTQEYAYRLIESLKTLPCFSAYNMSEGKIKPAKFVLTEDHIYEDITIDKQEDAQIVRISKACFVYANPFLVNLDGVRGRFFSKRLHHALVNFATDFGNDSKRVNSILKERFGCTTNVPNYSVLTAGTTNEDAGHFQKFNPDELVSIINMFEELPEGFHKTPHLNYLVRRLNGTEHPHYPDAAAVAWYLDNGYIEFMENAFRGDANNFETLRLILHEKTHFLWAFSFSEEIRNDWTALGGWYEDPNSESGWSTTKDTEFVSAYAHSKNPNEDMAESVAHYLKNPELLQSRSLPKYEFIRDRIMHGTRYISKIPEHLTFEVLNLFPDYDYPGKIKRLDIKVEGAPNDDKLLTVEIELNHIEGFEDGAIGGGTRLTSPYFIDEDGVMRSQFVDMGFELVDDNPHLLRGSVPISKYSKTGYWQAGDIIIRDVHGNQRFEGRNDCVWNMYVNNTLEDLEAPKYEPGSLNYELMDTVVEGHNAKNLRISYKVTDNVDIQTTFVRILRSDGIYSYGEQYGVYDPITQIATVDFLVTEFLESDDYWVVWLSASDFARNTKDVTFSDSPLDQPIQKIYIESTNPDTEAPEVDINRITVYAEPTNQENPDGETLVTINYYVRDNKSGVRTIRYSLRDPQGVDHKASHYHQHHYDGEYFKGDPTVWEKYTISCVLPKGSAPGIWGLSELELTDRAWNIRTYNFVETLIFEPDNSTADYVLFAELGDDSNYINLNVTSETDNVSGFNYRIINEDTGVEITGEIELAKPQMLRSSNDILLDISSLGTGNIVVIVHVKDKDGEVLAVRSSKINKAATPATLTWKGTKSADWNDAANWMEGGKPNNLSSIIIPANTSNVVTIPSGITIAGLTMKEGAKAILDGSINISENIKVEVSPVADRWYPVGFPFEISGAYYYGFDEGEELLNPYKVEEGGDYWLKEYLSSDDKFEYTQNYSAGNGYIVQYPEYFSTATLPVIYTSASDITLKVSSEAKIVPSTENTYELKANPTLNTITVKSENGTYYYKYEATNNIFRRVENDATAEIDPFESVVVVKNASLLKSIISDGDLTNLEDVNVSNDEVVRTQYFNLQGVEIKRPSNSSSGVFIIKQTMNSGIINTIKIIK
ncbi:hypothetical protein M2138_000843 [Dysgonomonadaceae bacterium PH5-43]|nr:hypothetical protein [Dysgonomonadaceae bacterium PH5-43]